MQKQEIYETVIQKYMTALAHCDLDGLCELFTPEAKYSDQYRRKGGCH